MKASGLIGMTAAAVALSLGGVSAAAAATHFTAVITADQQVPPGTSPGSGSGTFQLIDDPVLGTRLAISLLFSADFNFPGLPAAGTETVTLMQIHQGPRGLNGRVVHDLLSPRIDQTLGDVLFFDVPATGETRVEAFWDLGDKPGTLADSLLDFITLAAALQDGEDTEYYVNLRTEAWPTGAIRGQIVAAIPLPGAGLLLIGALGALTVLRRTG